MWKRLMLLFVGTPLLVLLGWVILPGGSAQMSYSPVRIAERAQRTFLQFADLIYFGGPSLDEILPKNFEVPKELRTADFVVRPLVPRDYRSDYDAVMASRKELSGKLYPESTWPEEDLTPRDNYVQLLRHEMEFSRRFAFTYTVESLDGKKTLGCIYITSSLSDLYEVDVRYWVVSGARHAELDQKLTKALVGWLEKKWPFHANKIAFPGRQLGWGEYLVTDHMAK